VAALPCLSRSEWDFLATAIDTIGIQVERARGHKDAGVNEVAAKRGPRLNTIATAVEHENQIRRLYDHEARLGIEHTCIVVPGPPLARVKLCGGSAGMPRARHHARDECELDVTRSVHELGMWPLLRPL